MSIHINVSNHTILAGLIGEFVIATTDEFKVVRDGQRGGWTISFAESELGIGWWRTVAKSHPFDGYVEVWESNGVPA